MKVATIKENLARIFDDNLRTKQWHNIVDYVIIGLIIVSTIEVFLSTIQPIEARFHTILAVIDYITIVFFTIEVTLRIWVCGVGEGNEKYQGWKGKLRYCFSFYGLVDILSTYTFYLSLFLPFSYTTFKVLRTLRLFRVFRYLKSFELLINAIKSKKQEFWISFQFLFITTIILALIAFFVENAAQPDSCGTSVQVIIWAFSQYIGDRGHFVTFQPITIVGRLIAFTIGLLQIALFAVPAGLIGSGFGEQIRSLRAKETLNGRIGEMEAIFNKVPKKRKILDNRPARYRFLPLDKFTTSLLYSESEIFACIRNSDTLRLWRFKSDESLNYNDMQIVEHFPKNTRYGYCSQNEQSPISIICPSAATERGIGHFSATVAENVQSNFISREHVLTMNDEEKTVIGANSSRFYVDFAQTKADTTAGIPVRHFVTDIETVCQGRINFILTVGNSAGADFSIEIGKPKDSDKNDFSESTVLEQDIQTIQTFYENLEKNVTDVVVKKNGIGEEQHFSFSTAYSEKGLVKDNLLGRCIATNCHSTAITIYINTKLLTSPNDERYYAGIKALIQTFEQTFNKE
ncbi:MAG: ion transporter [Bacteroidales bacterium]|nr:ion transporter [Bacteroidales bacterium]